MRRARFLQTSGAIVVAFSLPVMHACAPTDPYPDVDSWLAIDGNGDVTVSWGKVELGTGIDTAITQLVADELYVPFARVRLAGVTTGNPNQGYTAGSESLSVGAVAVRQAAAVARGVLLSLAAERFGVASGDLRTGDGFVYVATESKRRIGYGDLIGGRRLNERVTANPPMRAQTSDRVSGTSVPRIDIPPKLNGTFSYVVDVTLPGMLHGRVVYPVQTGATLKSYDESSLRDIPESIRVVRKGNFLGVVATDEWHAIRAAQELRVSWSGGQTLPAMTQLADVVRSTPGTDRTVINLGDVDAALKSATKTVRAEYGWPFQSHGSIGPSCGVADVKNGGATIWSSTQGVFPLRGAIAEALELPVDAVRVIYVEGSGCYGHNGSDDAATAAALLSQSVGWPVRVQYMRADETRFDPKGPAMVNSLQGALSADGAIETWDLHIWSPTHNGRPDGRAGNTLPGMLAGAPAPPIRWIGGDLSAPNNYRIPAQRITITDQRAALLRQSALRTLGGAQNTFANESFIDELVHAAGANPIDFRLRHLDDDRAKAVLEALRGDYQKGRGVAFVHYENTQAIVAAVADVSVDRKTGTVRVNHLWIAHDCGFVVNPNGLRNQIEGNALQATSRALLEQVTFDCTHVTSVDWVTYPILRFNDVPEVTIHVIDRPDQRIAGAGEATTAVIAPAIANAIFAQTGARLRTVPFTPSALKRALTALN
jgi:CO/xanthine dehydrogenase Mo-binding subunit